MKISKTFVTRILVSCYPEWANCKGFLKPKSIQWTKSIEKKSKTCNQKTIEQQIKNLQLEKYGYIKDIKVTSWATAQYFHTKQLR